MAIVFCYKSNLSAKTSLKMVEINIRCIPKTFLDRFGTLTERMVKRSIVRNNCQISHRRVKKLRENAEGNDRGDRKPTTTFAAIRAIHAYLRISGKNVWGEMKKKRYVRVRIPNRKRLVGEKCAHGSIHNIYIIAPA